MSWSGLLIGLGVGIVAGVLYLVLVFRREWRTDCQWKGPPPS